MMSGTNHRIMSEISMNFIVEKMTANVIKSNLELAQDGKRVGSSGMNVVHVKKDSVNRCIGHVRERRWLFLEESIL